MNYKEIKRKLLETDFEFREEYFKRDLAFELASLVVKARVKGGLTQADLAEAVGTKQSGISRVERGIVVPSITLLEKIASALKLRLVIDFKQASTQTYAGWNGSVPSPYVKVFSSHPNDNKRKGESKFIRTSNLAYEK